MTYMHTYVVTYIHMLQAYGRYYVLQENTIPKISKIITSELAPWKASTAQCCGRQCWTLALDPPEAFVKNAES